MSDVTPTQEAALEAMRYLALTISNLSCLAKYGDLRHSGAFVKMANENITLAQAEIEKLKV